MRLLLLFQTYRNSCGSDGRPDPEDVIKARFDRLLKEVQTISAEKAGALTGQTLPVLIEEKNEQDASLVTGRLSNNSWYIFLELRI